MTPYLLHHLLDQAPGSDEKPALIDGGRSLTYGALRTDVWRVASWLHQRGLMPGDRVAIVLPKSFDECVAILAVSMAGGVFVPVNAQLLGGQVAHIASDCGARFVITTDDRKAEIATALDAADTNSELVTAAEISATCCDMSGPAPIVGRLGEDLAAILYTSGSTGRPKGVMLSHRNLLAGARIVRTYLNITAEDRLLSVLPLSFDYGLNQLTTVLEQGATLVLATFRLGDDLVRILKEQRITGFAGVPAIWAILSRAAPSLPKTELPHLRYITNSGGAVPSATVRRLRELVPNTDVVLMYGLTEAFRSTYLPPDMVDDKPTSIGKAIPECEVMVVTKDGCPAAPGAAGILVHRGPTVSLGYWNRPEDTAAVLKPNPFQSADEGGDIVCYSGDLVTMDEDGFLYFVARDDAMIKSAGFRISPTEVEEVLMASGAFQQVAVIGLPDPWVGQKVVGVGVATDTSDGSAPDTKTLLKAVAQKLPSHMVPKTIDWVPALPTTANGKVDYKRLVAERT